MEPVIKTYKTTYDNTVRIVSSKGDETRSISEAFIPILAKISIMDEKFMVSFEYTIQEEMEKEPEKLQELNILVFRGRYTRKILKIEINDPRSGSIQDKYKFLIFHLSNSTGSESSISLMKNSDLVLQFLRSCQHELIGFYSKDPL